MKMKKSLLTMFFVLITYSVCFALNVVEFNPQYYPDPTRGRPVSLGSIYVGEPDLDPETPANQKTLTVRQENGSEVTVSQPISTNAGGVPVYNGSPVTLLVDGDYSLKVLNSSGSQVYYMPSNAEDSSISYKTLSYYSCDIVDALADIGSVTTTQLDIDCDCILPDGTAVTFTDNIIPNYIGGSIDGVSGGSTETLTYSIQPKAGIYQIHGSNLTVTGLVYSRPEWWGIDGTADNIEWAAAITATAGGMIEGDPETTYVLAAGLTIDTASTHIFFKSLPRSGYGFASSADIYGITIDDCFDAQLTNVRIANSNGSPTKANILLAGKAKSGKFDHLYLSGNKYSVLLDGSQGSDPGALFYNDFTHCTFDASTDELVYWSSQAGMNDNSFIKCLFSDSTGENKMMYITGNSNTIAFNRFETANSADYTNFTITDTNSIGNKYIGNRFETDGHGILFNGTNADEAASVSVNSNYWACNIVRVAVKNGLVNTDTAGRDKTFSGFVSGSASTTTIDVESTSGQKVISVAATSDFYEGQAIVLDDGNANEEWHIIDSIQAGVSLTTVGNLINTHAVAVVVDGNNGLRGTQTWNQDAVSKLRFWAQSKLVMELDRTPTASQNRTGLLILDADQDTIHQVYVGVSDSGGTGFRMLRITN
jgi:hypothetical protein